MQRAVSGRCGSDAAGPDDVHTDVRIDRDDRTPGLRELTGRNLRVVGHVEHHLGCQAADVRTPARTPTTTSTSTAAANASGSP